MILRNNKLDVSDNVERELEKMYLDLEDDDIQGYFWCCVDLGREADRG